MQLLKSDPIHISPPLAVFEQDNKTGDAPLEKEAIEVTKWHKTQKEETVLDSHNTFSTEEFHLPVCDVRGA